MALSLVTTRCAEPYTPTTVYAMPSTNTAGRLASRAGEMPSAVAVAVSIIATCWLVSFS